MFTGNRDTMRFKKTFDSNFEQGKDFPWEIRPSVQQRDQADVFF